MPGASRIHHQANPAVSNARGIFAWNTQGQLPPSTISPPKVGDSAGAISATAITSVETRARCGPWNRLKVSAWPTGISRPPARPWTKRQATNAENESAWPQPQAATANASIDSANSHLVPQRPASQVLTGITSVSPRM